MGEYILSVWKNHSEPSKWHYDICDSKQFFFNSYHYLLEYEQPYYYTPIFTGTQEECSKMADELKETYREEDSQ